MPKIKIGRFTIEFTIRDILLLVFILFTFGKSQYQDWLGIKQEKAESANSNVQDERIVTLEQEINIFKEYIKVKEEEKYTVKGDEVVGRPFEDFEREKEEKISMALEKDSLRKAKLYEEFGAVQRALKR